MNEPLTILLDEEKGNLIDFLCLGCGKHERKAVTNANSLTKFVMLHAIDSKCVSCKSDKLIFKSCMTGQQLWIKNIKDV